MTARLAGFVSRYLATRSMIAGVTCLVMFPGIASAVVVIRDGFGDADINNNGIALEEVDVEVNGSDGAYIPARLVDGTGTEPTNSFLDSVLDPTDTGIRWLQTRGFTGGDPGSGQSKPTIRIVDDSQGAMLETQSGTTGGLGIEAIDTGYAMSWESRGGGSHAAGFFDQTIALGPNVGDEVKVSFDFRIWRDAPNANTELEPEIGELRFGLFQDTDNQLGQTNPFAGKEEDPGTGFAVPTPAVWGQDEGSFGGRITGLYGAGDEIGTVGDAGWTAAVNVGNSASSGFVGGATSRIREEVQADRLLQGQDTQTIATPNNLATDPLNDPPMWDFFSMNPDNVYNVSLSLVRDTIETAGDTITSTLTLVEKSTGNTYSITGTEDLGDPNAPNPDEDGIQSDSWDYFALRNATSGAGEFDFIMDNFVLEVIGVNDLDGDFNGDGTVDAADYTVWRDGGSPNANSQADYDLWVANYGATSGTSAGLAVPEPSSAALLGLLVGAGTLGAKRQRNV